MIGKAAFVFAEEAEDLCAGVFCTFVSGFAGDDVDLWLAGGRAVGGCYVFNEAGEAVADSDIAEDLIEMQNAGMTVVYDDDISDIATSPNREVDEVFLFCGNVIIAEKRLDLFGGGQTARLFVEIDLYEIVAAESHTAKLFGFGDEEVFHQPPIEEGAQRSDADHAE